MQTQRLPLLVLIPALTWPVLGAVTVFTILSTGSDLNDRQLRGLFFLSFLSFPILFVLTPRILPLSWTPCKKWVASFIILLCVLVLHVVLMVTAYVLGLSFGDLLPV